MLADLAAAVPQEGHRRGDEVHPANGGVESLRCPFYKNLDVGSDGVWDVWQLESPTMIWYFRGSPHVHTWVNIRAKAQIRLVAARLSPPSARQVLLPTVLGAKPPYHPANLPVASWSAAENLTGLSIPSKLSEHRLHESRASGTLGRTANPGSIPEPVPGPGQILVRVEACGLCHSDLHLARGEWEGFKPRMPMPLVLGHEVAGRVARLGPGTQRLKEGDAVGVAWFHYTCGSCDYCRRDLEVFCDQAQITGVTVPGGFAEYLVAWESHATPIPEGLPAAEAAPLFCAGGTVFSALSKIKLDGSTHLGIWGAGGLGQYGIQLGKFAGSRVTAIDLFPSRLELARSLGADAAIGAEDSADWFSQPDNRVDVALVCASSAEAYRSAFQAFQKNGVLLIVGIPSAPLEWTAGDLIGRASGSFLRESRAAGSCLTCCSWRSAAWSAPSRLFPAAEHQ